eukprot:Nitzschia sp. Nitz4//scaffold1_size375055//147626//149253//NITZ4_000259-RA/size375055-augustus-gene-0.715-mRNA-1//-1//CDS//3329540994//3970//frame0
MKYFLCFYTLLVQFVRSTLGKDSEVSSHSNYGIDVSFPIQRPVSTNYPELSHNTDQAVPVPPNLRGVPIQPLGDRHQFYLDYLDGCRKEYEPYGYSQRCDNFEYDRMLMNRRQPQSMVNFTETGFRKVRAPHQLTALLQKFWEQNLKRQKPESWGAGNSYMNHWDTPTKLVPVDDTRLRGAGEELKRSIWAESSAILEEWTQQELQPASLYGIRIYGKGSVMLPHVDRLPLVISAIISVAQEIDEPWPTEIYDHQGRAHNVTMEPGDMLLFESASCIHGHPFPLVGKYSAAIFVHFETTGHPLVKNEAGVLLRQEGSEQQAQSSRIRGSSRKGPSEETGLDQLYHEATRSGDEGHTSSYDLTLPPYIRRESPEEAHWLSLHPKGWTPPPELLPPEAHIWAKDGMLDDLARELETRGQQVLTERDAHGWQVLHQGVASGNEEVVKLLVSNGADINSRTQGGYGETPLYIAEKQHGQDSSIVRYLRQMGALSIGPEL